MTSSSSSLIIALLFISSICGAYSRSLSLTTSRRIEKQDLIANEQGLKFSSLQDITSFILEQGYKPKILQSALFVSNVPNERLQLVRCGDFSTIPDLSRLDNHLGSAFDQQITKRNFTIILDGIDCYGWNLLYERLQNQVSVNYIENNLNSFISNNFGYLSLKLSISQPIEAEILSDISGQIYQKISSNVNQKVTVIETALPITLNNRFIIQKKQIQAIDEQNKPLRQEYIAYYERLPFDNGLHQKNSLSFTIETKKEYIKNNGQNCSLAILDFLDNTQYVDIDELHLHPSLSMSTYRMHDIERPSGVSPQHAYFLRYQFSDKDIEIGAGGDLIKLSMNETFLFHFRYRSPFNETHKPSFINSKPIFLLDCVDFPNDSIQTPLVKQNSLASLAANSLFKGSNFTTIEAFSTHQPNSFKRLVPVGNIDLKDLTLFVTLGSTLSAFLFFSFKIIQLAKKYNL